MYLRAAKTEAEDAGISTEGMAESVSQLRDELMALTGNKVDIMIDAEDGTYKSTVEILRELAAVWDDLSDTSRTNITELIGGGVRNANIISALMENFSIVDKAMKTSMESSGSALVENEKRLDSIAGKTEQFKAAFENLSTTFFSSDMIKGFVDAGTSLLTAVNSFAKNFGPIFLALTGGRILGTITSLKDVFKASEKLKTLKAVLEAFNISVIISQFRDLPILISTLFSDIKNGTNILVAFKNAFTLSPTPFLIAIGAAVSLFQAIKRAKEEAIQNAQAAAEAYDDEKQSLADYKTEVESLNEIINDPSSTHEDVYEARKNLYEIQSELAKEFGSGAMSDAGLDLLIQDANEAADAFERLAAARANAYLTENGDNINTAIEKMNTEQEYIIGHFNWNAMTSEARAAVSEIVALNDNLQLTPGYVHGIGDTLKLVVKGTPEAVKTATSEFKSEYDGLGQYMLDQIKFLAGATGEVSIDQAVANIMGSVGEIIDNYGNTATTGIDAYIQKTPEFKSAVQQMTDAQNEFATATLGSFDNTEDGVKALEKAIATSEKAAEYFNLDTTWNKKGGEAVKNSLMDEYELMQSRTDQMRLELNVALNVEEGSLENSVDSELSGIQDHLDYFKDKNGDIWSADILGSIEALTFDAWKDLPVDSLNEAQKAIRGLYDAATSHGFSSIEGMLSMFREYGLVIGTMSDQLGDAKRAFSSFIAENDVINNALKSQQNGASVTLEQYEALVAANSEYAKCLESNAGVLQFNANAVRNVAEAKIEEQKGIISANEAYARFRYDEVTRQLELKTIALETHTARGLDDVNSIEAEIEALEAESSELLDAINKYHLMAAAIREATSARFDWLNSKDDQQPGDSFTDVADAYAHLWEVLNGSTATRGDTGTSMYKSALDYLIPDDKEIRKSEATIRQYMRNLQSILKIDGKGNISDIKINEILRKLTQGEDAIFDKDKDGNYFAKEGKTLDDFAKKLGITKDLARDIIGMLNRNGMNIDIEDDDMESFIEKAEDAKNAIDTLYNTDVNKDFNIRINFDGIDDPEEKIKAINDSLEKASALTIKYDVGTREWKAAADIIDHLVEQKKMVQYDDILAFDTEKIEGQAKTALETVKQFINAQADLEKAERTYGKDSQQYKEAEESLKSAIDAIKKNITDEKVLSALKLNVSDLFNTEDLSTVTENIQNALQSVDATTLASELGIAQDAIIGIGSTAETLEDKDVSINITVTGQEDLDNALDSYNQLKDKDIKISASVDTNETIIDKLIDSKTLSDYNAILSVDTGTLDGDIAGAVDLLQQFVTKKAELDKELARGMMLGDLSGAEEAQAQLNDLVEAISKIDPSLLEKFNLDASNIDVDSISEALQNLTLEDLQFKLNINAENLTEAVSQYNKLKNKGINVKIDILGMDALSTAVGYYNSLQDKTVTITIVVKRVNGGVGDGFVDGEYGSLSNPSSGGGFTKGPATVSGTAHVTGTAKASGDWGTARPGQALVGELGKEIIVNPHTGRWYTVGEAGAQFVDIPQGAIVFNHLQTRHLLENGHVTSRGRAVAGGVALASGTAMSGGTITGGGRPSDSAISGGSGGSYGGSGSKAYHGAASGKTAFEQEYDRWNHLLEMEQARLKEYLEWLDKAYQDAYNSGQLKIEDFYKY